MRRFPVRFSESEASNHTPSLADFTTTTPELKFSVHTTFDIKAALWAGNVDLAKVLISKRMGLRICAGDRQVRLKRAASYC